MIGLLSYGLAAGAFATLNPCGFAMLPAVLSRYVARDSRGNPWLEGLAVGLLLTLGTLTSFSAVGLVVGVFGTGLARYMPWLNLALGVALLIMATQAFIGRAPGLDLPALRAPSGTSLREFYPFGVAYGFVSLGCTLPIFLSVVAGGAGRDLAQNALTFAAYGLGMGGVLTGVTLAVALGKDAVVQGLKRVGRYVELAGALGLLGAGTYLIYYQLRFLEFLARGSSGSLPLIVGLLAAVATAIAARLLYVRETRSA